MNCKTDKRYLFLSGIQRSGTTALTNVMNHHEQICICVERYKKLMHFERHKMFVPELFALDNLLDFSKGYTNLDPSHSDRFKGFYNDLEANYENLVYIGDKVPNNYPFIPYVHEVFPGARTIFIVRNLHDTACSWQARADREGDGWPEDKTAERSLKPWNEHNATVLKMKQRHPEDCLVVNYDTFFDGDPADNSAIKRLTDFLGLILDDPLSDAFRQARKKYASKLKGKERSLSQATLEYLEMNADNGSYDKVLAYAD